MRGGSATLTYSQFLDDVHGDKVQTATIDATGAEEGKLKYGTLYTSQIPVALQDTTVSPLVQQHDVQISGQGPPVLLLGTYEIGGRDCAWPNDPVSPLLAMRRGREVTTTNATGRTVTCSNAPTGRVTVAARAGETSTTLTSLVLQRR